MRKKYIGLYEEPTTYQYEYVQYPLKLIEKSNTSACISKPNKKVRPKAQFSHLVTLSDTFQHVHYDACIPFNALWEPKDTVNIYIKPSIRRNILGDVNLQYAIKTRPRIYMSPAVSLDDVKDSRMRKVMVDFTYATTSNSVTKDVWKDFEPQPFNLSKDDQAPISDVQLLQSTTMKPYVTQDHISLKDNKIDQNCEKRTNIFESEKECEIIKLVETDTLRKAYDKFPLEYTGYRPHTTLGIPLAKKELPITHPDLTISQLIYRKYSDDCYN